MLELFFIVCVTLGAIGGAQLGYWSLDRMLSWLEFEPREWWERSSS